MQDGGQKHWAPFYVDTYKEKSELAHVASGKFFTITRLVRAAAVRVSVFEILTYHVNKSLNFMKFAFH